MAVLQRIAGRIGDIAGLDRLGRPLAAQVDRATQSRVVRNALSGTWLGHPLHPMLTDVPIGAWLMAGLLDIAGGKSSQPAARRLVGLGVLAAIPTAAAGASDWAETVDADQRVGLVHGLGISSLSRCSPGPTSHVDVAADGPACGCPPPDSG